MGYTVAGQEVAREDVEEEADSVVVVETGLFLTTTCAHP